MKRQQKRNQKVRLADDIGRMCPELKGEIEKLASPPDGPYAPGALCAWLVSVTFTVLRICLHIGRRLLQEVLDVHLHGIDRPGSSSALRSARICPCASCGSVVWHYNGEKPRKKSFRSLFGEITLWRFQARCSRCKATFYPLDHILGLSSALKMLPGLQQVVLLLGTHLSFRDAAKVLSMSLGVRLAPETIRKVVDLVGRAVATRQAHVDWEPELEILRRASHQGQGRCTLEFALDGAMLPLNEKPKGEPDSHKEARSFSVRLKDAKGKLLAKLIISRLTPLQSFLRSAAGLVDECRESLGITRIILAGDAARWIWQFAEQNDIARTLLDWYHLRTYIRALFDAADGGGSPPRRKRLKAIKTFLWNGRVDDALQQLSGFRARGKAQRKAKDDLFRYVDNNRAHIINYGWNWCRKRIVGSGAIEGGQKKVIHDRMKCTGMRWSDTGGDHMMAARCSQLNGTAEADVLLANLAA